MVSKIVLWFHLVLLSRFNQDSISVLFKLLVLVWGEFCFIAFLDYKFILLISTQVHLK